MVEPDVVDGLVEKLDALRYHSLVPVDDDEVERVACEAADALLALRAEVEELRAKVTRRLSDAPCDQCGYNGPGYYQPATHPCAEAHHRAEDAA